MSAFELRALLVVTLGCSAAAPPSSQVSLDSSPATTRSRVDSGVVGPDGDALRTEAERLIDDLEAMRNLRLVGMDEGPVPDFALESVDGTEFDSAELIGHQPFVVAFFATWCEVCERKLRSLRSALDASGPMLVIPISFDGLRSLDRIERYLRACGIAEPAVLASEYPLMVTSYNPFDTIPLLVIVGQNGGLVDYQLGYEIEHEQRLVASLALAHVIAPLARPARAPESDPGE